MNEHRNVLANVISVVTVGYLVWMGLGDAHRRVLSARARWEAQRVARTVEQAIEPWWKSELRNHATENPYIWLERDKVTDHE